MQVVKFFFLVDCVCDLPTYNKYKYNTQYNKMQTATRTNTIPTQAGKGFRMTYFKIFANTGKTDTYQCWQTYVLANKDVLKRILHNFEF